MGFFEEQSGEIQNSSAPGGSSFFDTQVLPPANQEKISQYQSEANIAQQEANKLNSVGTLFKETIKGIPQKANEFAGKVLNSADEAVRNTWETYKSTPEKLIQDINDSADNLAKSKLSDIIGVNTGLPTSITGIGGETGKGILKAGFRTARDVANAIFSPLSSAIGSLMQTTGGQKLTDSTGNIIADKSGITDIPAFQNFAMTHPNFAEDFNGLLLLLMSGGDNGQKVNPKEVVDKINNLAQKTLDTAKPEIVTPPEVKLSPSERQTEYAKRMGYEPYTPPEKLPTIDMGKPAKDSLPVIQIGESIRVSKNSNGDYVYEPIKEQQPTQVTKQESTYTKPELAKETITKVSPEIKKSSLSETLKQEAIVKGMKTDLGDSPIYETRPMETFNKAANYVIKNPEDALKVARGEISAPEGTLHSEIYSALKIKAFEDGDNSLLYKLATDPKINAMGTEAGRIVKGYDTRLTNDPVETAKEIIQYRKDFTEKKMSNLFKNTDIEKIKSKYTTEIKDEISKNIPKRSGLVDFIKSIQC